MIDYLLRSADPARDLHADPDGPAARDMVRAITALPRKSSDTRRHSPVRFRRIALGGALAGAAAVTATVLTVPGHTPAAYGVTRRSDGSVSVVLHWNELRNPTKLQEALDRAGARTRILTAQTSGNGPDNIPACARPISGSPYSARAVQWDFPDSAREVNGIVIRPDHFPADGTFVIEVGYVRGTHKVAQIVSFMARGRVPTCAYLPGSN
jgi:hypothetical protein